MVRLFHNNVHTPPSCKLQCTLYTVQCTPLHILAMYNKSGFTQPYAGLHTSGHNSVSCDSVVDSGPTCQKTGFAERAIWCSSNSSAAKWEKITAFSAKKIVPGFSTGHVCELLTAGSSELKLSKKGNMLETSTHVTSWGCFVGCICVGEGEPKVT